MEFNLNGEHGLNVEIWDHDITSADDMIGEGFLVCSEYLILKIEWISKQEIFK
jgi:hypothetical protein